MQLATFIDGDLEIFPDGFNAMRNMGFAPNKGHVLRSLFSAEGTLDLRAVLGAPSRLWWGLFLFSVLSIADLALTYSLVNSKESVYEWNPVAAEWLARFGWKGIVTFKSMSCCLFCCVCILLASQKPRLAYYIVAAGCGILATVLIYSALLSTDCVETYDYAKPQNFILVATPPAPGPSAMTTSPEPFTDSVLLITKCQTLKGFAPQQETASQGKVKQSAVSSQRGKL
jgi:hypothetical protein